MSFSNYLENELLDQILRNAAAPAIPNVYVSLHSGDPGETGIWEITGGSYARQSGAFDVASNGASANSNLLSYTNMPALTVTHVGLYDNVSAGNFLGGGALTSPRTPESGDTLQIEVGSLDITLD